MVPSPRTLDVEPGPPVLPDTAWVGGTPARGARQTKLSPQRSSCGLPEPLSEPPGFPPSPPLHPRAPVKLRKRESHSPPESQPTRPLFHFSWSELSTLGEAGATGSQTAPTSPTCSHTLCGCLRGFQVRHRFVRLLGERRLAPCAGGQEREGGGWHGALRIHSG